MSLFIGFLAQVLENTDQKNSIYGHFSRTVKDERSSYEPWESSFDYKNIRSTWSWT